MDLDSDDENYTTSMAMRPLQPSIEYGQDHESDQGDDASQYSEEISSSSAYEADEEDESNQDENEDINPDQPLQTNKRPLRYPTPSDRPLKRPKPSAPFHLSYLSLLNDDILDAASGFIPDDSNSLPELYPSQIGLVNWSVPEKTLFFSAISRLGPDDALGISRRIKTKSELEVAAYISLLKTASQSTGKLGPSEIPAALALSPAICSVLESFADTLASKQEHHEETVEAARWNHEANWLITPSNRKEIESSPPEGMLSLDLFRVRTWLRLSERIFMNSIVDDYQWETFAASSDAKPGIRATTLEDFYNLVVSITRRLVASSIYVAESRIKTKGADLKRVIWPKDVRAAAVSIGLKEDSQEFWAKCARRLRLEVWDEQHGKMSYDRVEKALGLENVSGAKFSHSDDEGAEEEEEEEEIIEQGLEMDSDESGDDKPERDAIKAECDELLQYSALEVPDSKKDRDSLRQRIKLERKEEAEADKLDLKASYEEEARLWDLLGQSPPVGIPKIEVPQRKGNPKGGTTVEDLVKGFSRDSNYGNWRAQLEYVPSRWEMEYKIVEEERKEKELKEGETEGGKKED